MPPKQPASMQLSPDKMFLRENRVESKHTKVLKFLEIADVHRGTGLANPRVSLSDLLSLRQKTIQCNRQFLCLNATEVNILKLALPRGAGRESFQNISNLVCLFWT